MYHYSFLHSNDHLHRWEKKFSPNSNPSLNFWHCCIFSRGRKSEKRPNCVIKYSGLKARNWRGSQQRGVPLQLGNYSTWDPEMEKYGNLGMLFPRKFIPPIILSGIQVPMLPTFLDPWLKDNFGQRQSTIFFDITSTIKTWQAWLKQLYTDSRYCLAD